MYGQILVDLGFLSNGEGKIMPNHWSRVAFADIIQLLLRTPPTLLATSLAHLSL